MILRDVLRPGLRVVFCGTAAGVESAKAGAYYAGPGNQFWTTLHDVGLTPRRLSPAEFMTLLEHGIGLSDIVNYRAGCDQDLQASDFDVIGFRRKIEHFKPKAVAFNGKRAAGVFNGCRSPDLDYGRQVGLIGASSVWVLPSTSGAARGFWNIEHWRTLAKSAMAC